MPSFRLFVALSSSDQLRKALHMLQQTLRNENADVKWDDPGKFHNTLKFLGNVLAAKLPEVTETLVRVTAEASTFSLTYNTIGAFPDTIHPRVIWVGAPANDVLTSLVRRIELACERLGFLRETRVYHPHITLGRVKGPTNLARLTARVKSLTFDPIETTCTEVLLVKSDLYPTGSVYTILNSFPLNA